jgi:hypothetical protein
LTRLAWVGAFAVLLAFLTLWFFQVTRSGWCNDESAHIPAGLYALETGRMDAYRVNPPLHRMIAAIPLLLDRPQIEWHYSESPFVRIEYQFAQTWVRDNQSILRRQLFLARATVLLFFALGLWSIVRWAWRMYGTASAWLAALLWSFNPDVITHSSVVAPDLPAAASGLFVGYLFWEWLRLAERPFPWSVAAATALAILCKFSWLFLLPLLPLVTMVVDGNRIRTGESGGQTGVRPIAAKLLLDGMRLVMAFSLTLLLINWCYGFDGTGTRLGAFEFISDSLSGEKLASEPTGNRFANGPIGWVPMPLPAEMLRGIDYLRWEFERGMPCYLNGQWQNRGWWYFHLYAMGVKIPLGYWVLIALGVVSFGWQRCRGRNDRSFDWLPLMLASIFVTLVSSQTGFTHHVRYVLPAYGFLFLTASRVMTVLPRWIGIAVVAVCFSGTVSFHGTHLGLAHTFFNPLAGGPDQGWRHLGYSNVDWGQSTYRMVDWILEHPEQRPMTVLFRQVPGSSRDLIAEIDDVSTNLAWRQLANSGMAPKQAGWYLISSFQMTQKHHEFFRNLKPVAQPWPDVLLFHIASENDEAMLEH